MRTQGRLAVCTVLELASLLAVSINTERVKDNKFPDCDFAILEDDNEDIEYLKNSASGWYGIKAVDLKFDSDDLIVFADYYGGGCPNFGSFWNGIGGCVDVTKCFLDILLGTLEIKEAANEDTKLIVEFLET